MMAAILKPTEITINDNKYYEADALKTYDPVYFHDCSRFIKSIIKKKNITTDNYIYATWSKKTWKQVVSNTPKSKLLLSANWVENNIPKMSNGKKVNYEFLEAPGIIILDNSEKFRDNEGKIVEIETRGKRISNSIYFLASDVSRAFDMPNLLVSIFNVNSCYIKDVHYRTFICPDITQAEKKVFITYKGLLKILFCSRTGRAAEFIEWATNTLFTVQMGSKEKKEELASGLIGIPAKSLREVLKTNVSSTPCIYRFALGTVKELRKKMNLSDEIPDDHIIIKYGYTDDLVRRISEHIKTYEKLTNKLELIDYVYIDPKFLSQAESQIKEFFQEIETPVKYESFNELIAINPKHDNSVKKQFKYIHNEFSGSVRDLIEQIDKLKNTHKIEIMTLEYELAQKDLAYERLKNELLELKLKI